MSCAPHLLVTIISGFVHLSDGSSFHPVQVVAPSTLPNYTDEVLKLIAGCAVEATGTAGAGAKFRGDSN
jgi:aspartyl/asparaginyl-tRNA synthetase